MEGTYKEIEALLNEINFDDMLGMLALTGAGWERRVLWHRLASLLDGSVTTIPRVEQRVGGERGRRWV